jgi:hypothetical protein
MKNNKYIGSNFDDFLKEEGVLEEIEEIVAEKILVFQEEAAKRR